jgi:hypothetical protein
LSTANYKGHRAGDAGAPAEVARLLGGHGSETGNRGHIALYR